VTGLQLAITQSTLAAYLLAVARTAGFVLTCPPFNSRSIPAQAKVGLAVTLAMPLTTSMVDSAPTLTGLTVMFQMLAQTLVGVGLGFLVQLALSTVQAVGDLLDTVGGFSAATALDPMLLVQTSVMGRLHQVAAWAVFFATGSHLLVLHALARTVHTAPIASFSWQQTAAVVTQDVAGLFASALQIAGPVVAAMLVADISLGLMTKAAPALNAFSLGYPLKILFTLVLAGLVVARLPEVMNRLIDHATISMVDLPTAPSPTPAGG
jgi:flagellar biosynthesis protein FliR